MCSLAFGSVGFEGGENGPPGWSGVSGQRCRAVTRGMRAGGVMMHKCTVLSSKCQLHDPDVCRVGDARHGEARGDPLKGSRLPGPTLMGVRGRPERDPGLAGERRGLAIGGLGRL